MHLPPGIREAQCNHLAGSLLVGEAGTTFAAGGFGGRCSLAGSAFVCAGGGGSSGVSGHGTTEMTNNVTGNTIAQGSTRSGGTGSTTSGGRGSHCNLATSHYLCW